MQDCLIIGGGLIGMLTARELAKSGLSVSLIEKGQLGQESSWAGGGIISPLYPWRYPDAVSQLAKWSQQHYPQLAEDLKHESGVDPELTQNGLLILAANETEQAQSWASEFDSNLRVVSAEEVETIECRLNPELHAQGIWMPGIHQIRNPRLIQALRGSLQYYGVQIIENTEVDDILFEKNRVQGVRTQEKIYYANQVVVASGAWTAQILQKQGITIEIQPVLGQMLLFRTEPGLVSRIVLSEDRYVIPRRDGRVLVGSTLEHVGFAKTTTEEAKAELHAEALRLIPALADYPIEHHWAGLRPGSPQGIPYIYEVEDKSGLFVNSGHFRNGVVLGPASVNLLTSMMLEQTPNFDLNPYNICV